MYLIQSSKDLLYIVLAFCILWLTIFMAWFIYYLAMIMRQVFLSTKEMRERVKKVDEVMKALKEKIEHSASYLLLIGEGVKKLVEIAKNYGVKKAKK
jgi:CHASE3 domain sensor protein